MTKSKKKLVLFDIDGTLIYHVPAPFNALNRYAWAIKKVYGVDVDVDTHNWKYEGSVDRSIVWDMLHGTNVTREEFLSKFSDYSLALREFLETNVGKNKLYVSIPEAKQLIELITSSQRFFLGILTGNTERMAAWKLEHTELNKYFDFGLYGEEADDRIALARLVFEKAQKVFKTTFTPDDIFVIGDTVHDIRCGEAIGAKTIAVMSGKHTTREVLAAEKPDLLVETLMDKQVLEFFGL
jgi:phosphoglycolate phosphatase-like HAD superfamily hydrolase